MGGIFMNSNQKIQLAKKSFKTLEKCYPTTISQTAYIHKDFQQEFMIGNMPFGTLPLPEFQYDLDILKGWNDWNCDEAPDLICDQIFIGILLLDQGEKDVYHYWQAMQQGTLVQLFQQVTLKLDLSELKSDYVAYDFPFFKS